MWLFWLISGKEIVMNVFSCINGGVFSVRYWGGAMSIPIPKHFSGAQTLHRNMTSKSAAIQHYTNQNNNLYMSNETQWSLDMWLDWSRLSFFSNIWSSVEDKGKKTGAMAYLMQYIPWTNSSPLALSHAQPARLQLLCCSNSQIKKAAQITWL